MKKTVLLLSLVVIASILFFRKKAQNYTDAYLEKSKAYTTIKLKGKRELMIHDLISLFKTKSYEDSLSLIIPNFKNGTIPGKELLVNEGHYKYEGEITILEEKLNVNLLINNTDDHKLEPSDWNGEYILIK